MTRAHVRLLGPCFKTGRMGSRPTRHRGPLRACPVSRHTQSESTEDSPLESNARPEPRAGRGYCLGPPAGQHRAWLSTPPKKCLPSRRASDRRRTGGDAHLEKCARRQPPNAGSVLRIRDQRPRPLDKLNSQVDFAVPSVCL